MTLLLLLSLTVAYLSWDAPIENVDGSPLIKCVDRTPEEVTAELDCLDGYTIYYGTSPRVYDQPEILLNETVQDYVVEPSTVGTYFFTLTANDLDGNESAFSNEVSKLIEETSIPLPPIILAQDEVVFTVIKQPNRFVLLPIGTVPAGTECDPNNSTNGHGAVPTAAVVWTSPTGSRPIVVVAQCDG